MLDSLRTKVNSTKQFVRQHSTLIACTTTAVASIYVTREIDLRTSRKLFYELGQEHGIKDTVLFDALSFIETKELDEAFADFVLDRSE